MTPQRVDAATAASPTSLPRPAYATSAAARVRPQAVIRVQRTGGRLFRRCKSTSGRSHIPVEARQLIQRIADENPRWGEERIADDRPMMLGLRVLPRTVRKYMPKRPPGGVRSDQRRADFPRYHAGASIVCDYLVTVIYPRAQLPRQQVQQISIEIDEARTAHEVSEIIETDYFRELERQADQLRCGCHMAGA